MIEWITSIFEKNRHDQFVLLDLWKRSTLIESIPSIFKKDWPWLNRSRRSLKKIDGSYSIFFMIESIFRSQKTIDSIENDDWIPNPAILRVAAAHPTVSQVQLVPQVRQVMSTGLKLKEMFSLPPKLVRSMHCPCHPPMGEEVVNVVHGSRINTLHRSRPEALNGSNFCVLCLSILCV